jgi:acyl transferase domain-containing protein
LEEWKRPLISIDGAEKEWPLRAGISSFGAGGSNAHVVIEEYVNRKTKSQHGGDRAQLIILSAKNEERLRRYVEDFISFFSETESYENEPRIVKMLEDDVAKVFVEHVEISVEDLDREEDVAGYGVDEVKLSSILDALNEIYDVNCSVEIYGFAKNIEEMSHYLFGKFRDEIVAYYIHDIHGGENSRYESDGSTPKLQDIAYTLQVGRDSMEERLAVIVTSIKDLIDTYKKYLEGTVEGGLFYHGNIKDALEDRSSDSNTEEAATAAVSALSNDHLEELAKSWVEGHDVDWESLYFNGGEPPNRVSLPVYPFKQVRCWISSTDKSKNIHELPAQLHDLLDSNESTLEVQQYCKVLTGNEYYLRDHVVGGEKVLPGVAYLEMVRLAGDLAGGGSKVRRIEDVVWMQPVRMDVGNVELYVGEQ